MSDPVGDMQARLLAAETSQLTGPLDIIEILRDARYLIQNLSLSETSAQNRAAELEKEGGIPQSLRRIAHTLEALHPYLITIARTRGL